VTCNRSWMYFRVHGGLFASGKTPTKPWASARAMALLIAVSTEPEGPDLSQLFDAHVAAEFVTKDADATMTTMTDDPTVIHVPVLTVRAHLLGPGLAARPARPPGSGVPAGRRPRSAESTG
jgi:hypothetical protein